MAIELNKINVKDGTLFYYVEIFEGGNWDRFVVHYNDLDQVNEQIGDYATVATALEVEKSELEDDETASMVFEAWAGDAEPVSIDRKADFIKWLGLGEELGNNVADLGGYWEDEDEGVNLRSSSLLKGFSRNKLRKKANASIYADALQEYIEDYIGVSYEDFPEEDKRDAINSLQIQRGIATFTFQNEPYFIVPEQVVLSTLQDYVVSEAEAKKVEIGKVSPILSDYFKASAFADHLESQFIYGLDGAYPDAPWLGGDSTLLNDENLGELYFFEGTPPE